MSDTVKVETSYKYTKIIIFIVVVVGGIVLARITGFSSFLTNVNAMQEFFSDLGLIGYLVYILLYIVVALFMLPASITTIVAGIVFGPILGAILALTGSTIGACASFITSRYIARDAIVNKFDGNKIFNNIEKGVKDNGTSFLILTRLVPIFPYNVQNYAYGVTNIKFSTYAIITFICMAPGAFIYAYMAGEIVTNGLSISLLVKFALAGVVLFLVSLVPKYLSKKKGISLED